MKMIADRLPTVMGASAGILVVFLSLLAQVSPLVCALRAVAAYVVFAAFGMLIRYVVLDTLARQEGAQQADVPIERALPGTSVREALDDGSQQEAA